jgi:hypothetical protein
LSQGEVTILGGAIAIGREAAGIHPAIRALLIGLTIYEVAQILMQEGSDPTQPEASPEAAPAEPRSVGERWKDLQENPEGMSHKVVN